MPSLPRYHLPELPWCHLPEFPWCHLPDQAVIIAKASKPIARIVPLSEAAPSERQFGVLKGWIECAPDAFNGSDEVADLFEKGDIFPD